MALEVPLAVAQGSERGLGQRAQPFGGLVKVRVLAPVSQAIELLDGTHQRSRRKPQLLLHLVPALTYRRNWDIRLNDRTTENLVIHQQPGAALGLAQYMMRHPAVITVLVDEALA